MADHPRYPDTGNGTGAAPDGAPAARKRRRVQLAFWIIAIAVVLLVIVLHVTGTVGPGTNG
jgi:hypothetical protein